jgi:hypothetical protein
VLSGEAGPPQGSQGQAVQAAAPSDYQEAEGAGMTADMIDQIGWWVVGILLILWMMKS